jgi:hypothetical protein
VTSRASSTRRDLCASSVAATRRGANTVAAYPSPPWSAREERWCEASRLHHYRSEGGVAGSGGSAVGGASGVAGFVGNGGNAGASGSRADSSGSERGCGCRLTASHSKIQAGLLLPWLALAWLVRRRRKVRPVEHVDLRWYHPGS